MPFIIKNGKYYGSGGGSGDSSIDITQAEYDKLEASGKVNHDVTYYITDGVYEEGEGNTNIVKLTQAQYDELGDEKLSDNNIYLITDADELTAENLAYDDSETGLGVNNVQDAISEQNKNLEWKLAGEDSSGTGTISLPTKFNELDVNVMLPGSTARYKFHILYDELFDVEVGFMNGYYYASNNNVCASVVASKTVIHSGHCSVNGSVVNPTYLGVRYR